MQVTLERPPLGGFQRADFGFARHGVGKGNQRHKQHAAQHHSPNRGALCAHPRSREIEQRQSARSQNAQENIALARAVGAGREQFCRHHRFIQFPFDVRKVRIKIVLQAFQRHALARGCHRTENSLQQRPLERQRLLRPLFRHEIGLLFRADENRHPLYLNAQETAPRQVEQRAHHIVHICPLIDERAHHARRQFAGRRRQHLGHCANFRVAAAQIPQQERAPGKRQRAQKHNHPPAQCNPRLQFHLPLPGRRRSRHKAVGPLHADFPLGAAGERTTPKAHGALVEHLRHGAFFRVHVGERLHAAGVELARQMHRYRGRFNRIRPVGLDELPEKLVAVLVNPQRLFEGVAQRKGVGFVVQFREIPGNALCAVFRRKRKSVRFGRIALHKLPAAFSHTPVGNVFHMVEGNFPIGIVKSAPNELHFPGFDHAHVAVGQNRNIAIAAQHVYTLGMGSRPGMPPARSDHRSQHRQRHQRQKRLSQHGTHNHSLG